jgi:hypothetical protein
VRELQHVIERAVILSKGRSLELGPLEVRTPIAAAPAPAPIITRDALRNHERVNIEGRPTRERRARLRTAGRGATTWHEAHDAGLAHQAGIRRRIGDGRATPPRVGSGRLNPLGDTVMENHSKTLGFWRCVSPRFRVKHPFY